jgi:YHS domain-containing protein
MKTLFALVLAVALVGCCCMHGKTPTTAPTTEPIAVAKPVNKFCPVDTDKPIDPMVTYMYNGQLYGFCCADCVKEFKANPQKFAANAK